MSEKLRTLLSDPHVRIGQTSGGISFFSGLLGQSFTDRPKLFLFGHANGFCKEIWAPIISELRRLMRHLPNASPKQMAQDSKDGASPKRAANATGSQSHPIAYLALDFPGHGGSSSALGPLGLGGPAVAPWGRTLAPALGEALAEYSTFLGNTQYDVIGIGHSLGGAAMLLKEIQDPGTFLELVLFEPVLFPPSPGKRLKKAEEAERENQMHLYYSGQPFISDEIANTLKRARNPLVKRALKRVRHWPDEDTARNFVSSRFPTFTQDSLDAYILGGFKTSHPVDNKEGAVHCDLPLVLACDPITEAAYYISVGDSLFPHLSGIACPVNILYGQSSEHFSGPWGDTQRHFRNISSLLKQSHTHQIPSSGHFLPMEQPSMCAKIMYEALNCVMKPLKQMTPPCTAFTYKTERKGRQHKNACSTTSKL